MGNGNGHDLQGLRGRVQGFQEAWRWITPIGLVALSTMYGLDRALSEEKLTGVNDKITTVLTAVEKNSTGISALTIEVHQMGTTLAGRGVQLQNIEKELDTHYHLINRHEGRIRNLELNKKPERE